MWRRLPQDKVAARAEVRRTRRERVDAQRPENRVEAAHRLASAMADRLRDRPAGTLAAYRALRTEPEASRLIDTARDAGWRVILPVMLPDKDLTWVDWQDHFEQQDDTLGPEAIAEAAMIVVPALAVDLQGMRLGQGGGSYDRALARRDPTAWTVAVVHDDEVALQVPTDPHDLPVDAVLTSSYGILDLPAADAVRTRPPGT